MSSIHCTLYLLLYLSNTPPSSLKMMLLSLYILLISAVFEHARAECPNLVAQFGDPNALDISELDVFVNLEDFSSGLAFEIPLVSSGVTVDTFASVESLESYLQNSLFPVVVPASLETVPLYIRLNDPAPHTLYYVVSVWSLDLTLSSSGCPQPNMGSLDPGEERTIALDLPCGGVGTVYMQACLTVGTEPFALLNETYTTLTFYFARECNGTLGECNTEAMVIPAEFCITLEQAQELVTYPEGSWSLIITAFNVDFSNGTRGYCLVDAKIGGLIPLVTSDVVNAGFPIPEAFPELKMYIESLDEITSPVVYSLSFDVEDPNLLDIPYVDSPQGILPAGRIEVVINMPCRSPGLTRVFMFFNASGLVGGTLYREDYNFYFHKNCTPANNNNTVVVTSSSDANLGVKVGVPISMVIFLLLLAVVVVIIMVLLTRRQRKRIEISQQLQLQELASNNLYLQRCYNTNPFECLEQYNMEYNYASIEVVGELGEGAFGRVFKARAPGLQRGGYIADEFVAVKTLKQDAQSDVLDSFVKEVKTCAQFDHVNVIRLLGICTQSFQRCMIFEYMDLGSLGELLRLSDPENPDYPGPKSDQVLITPEVFLHCVLQLVQGLNYLASLKFVHRDIATRNCLVDHNLVMKIADFGLSREVSNMDYYRIGSAKAYLPVRWMPPEALLYGKFTVKSDVWSFGVLMWEVYTFGHQPYSGISNYEVIDRIKTGRVLECPELCPASVYDIMKSCWTRVPSKRVAMSEVLSRLQQLIGHSAEFKDRYVTIAPVASGYANMSYAGVVKASEIEENKRVEKALLDTAPDTLNSDDEQ